MSGSNVFELVRPPPHPACNSCGEPSGGFKLCDACAAKWKPSGEGGERERRDDAIQAFVRSVPINLRWARFDSLELARRVKIRTAITDARRLPADTLVAVFMGPSASGKSSCAVARARASAESGRRVLFVSALELVVGRRELRLGQPFEALRDALRADLCLLDGLGEEDEHDPGRSAFVDLIFGRHQHGRPTLITTGLTDDQLRRRYSDPLVRRLREEGRSHLVQCGAFSRANDLGGAP